MAPFRRIIALIERNLTWLQLITGGGLLTLVGWLSKHAAEQTAWVQSLGPYGVWFAALAGVLVAATICAALGWARYVWNKGSAMNHWRIAVGDAVNPMESTFRNQRIRLVDLVSPIQPVIHGKTFIDCELLGPINLVILATTPGGGMFNGTHFANCDLVEVADGCPIINVVAFRDCNVMRGVVHRATLYVPSSAVEFINQVLPGASWITRGANPPGAAPSPPSP